MKPTDDHATLPPSELRISVVIPALNEADRIDACLDAVLAQQDSTAEIIVVDGGSADDTVARAERSARVISARRGRASQMNAGARVASGDILLFLHADSLVPPDAFAAIRRALANPAVAGGTFRVRFDRDSALLRFYAYCTRLRSWFVRFGDQGIFVRRSTFQLVGGFPELPLMEDVDFMRRLRRTGRLALVPLSMTTSCRRFDRHGVIRQQLRNGALLTLYLLGASPTRLARWYENVSR